MVNCIYTVGHSSLSAEEFISLLQWFEIQTLADVRRFASSQKHPHFHGGTLQKLLESAGMHYFWFEALGGRRKGLGKDSPNMLLNSRGFRNYADYMMTREFQEAVKDLLVIAESSRTAIMCAEAVYWRCHRMLLSDYLTAKGWQVLHILNRGEPRRHELLKGAVVTPERSVLYPASSS